MTKRRGLVLAAWGAAVFSLLTLQDAAAAQPPRVVATILPIHSLTAAVMEGVATPDLLVSGAASPHSYSLRPSEARRLEGADVVIRIGDGMETFLRRPLETLARGARVVTLSEAPGVALLPLREGGAWEPHDHGHDDHGHDSHAHDDHGHDSHAHGDHAHGDEDLHVWLSPANAVAMVAAIAEALAAVDPDHGDIYRRNAAQVQASLGALEADLARRLAPVRERPFVVFHDAYQYLEVAFGLNAVGSLTLDPERQPGAQRLREVRERIVELGAVCVFREPQFEPRLIETLVEGTAARRGVLDPLGAALEPGPQAYGQLMHRLADSLLDCLGETS